MCCAEAERRVVKAPRPRESLEEATVLLVDPEAEHGKGQDRHQRQRDRKRNDAVVSSWRETKTKGGDTATHLLSLLLILRNS